MIPEFQFYLKQLIEDASRRQQSFYISTDAIERLPLKLMAQKVAEKKPDGQPEENMSPVPVLEGIRSLCTKHQHILLVGRPGSGKSTALNQFLIAEATRSIENSALPIPVLVQLKSDQPILELIRKALRRGKLRLDETAIEDLLFEGKLLLLLDGINEIPRQDLQQALQDFREDNPDVLMVFATRDLASGGYLGIEKQLEMQPLTPSQLRDFVGQSFPEQSAEFLNQLSDQLKELGETPLLLEMLCDVFRRTGKIPENLGLVFREFTQHYERNLKEGVRIESDLAWWKPVLKQLAWVMMQGEKATEFRVAIGRDEAVRAIAQFLKGKVPYAEDFARKCLRDLQKHHLIEAGENSEELEFLHQLIQEYYAAEALLAQLPRLDDARLKREFLNYLKWTEPLALMLALVENEAQAGQVVMLALEVDWKLAARLAGEVKREFQEQTVGLIDDLNVPNWLKINLLQKMRSNSAVLKLLKCVEYSELKIVRYAVYVLGEIGSESEAAIPALLKLIEHSDYDISWFAAWAIGEISSEAAIPALLRLIEHSDYEVRWRAKLALDAICSETAIPSLLKLAEHSDSDIGWKAVAILGRVGSDTATTSLLKLVENSHPNLRERAATALGGIGSKTAVLGLLKLAEDPISDVRWSAAHALGEIGSEIAISGLLKLVEDPISDVRISTAEALSKINSPTAIAALFKLAKDTNLGVQERATEILVDLNSASSIPSSSSFDSDLEQKAAEILSNISSEPNISDLLKLIEDSNSDVYQRVALGNFTKMYANKFAQYLPHLLTLISTDSGEDVDRVILAIQENCKYYNYEIFQAYLEAQKADQQKSQKQRSLIHQLLHRKQLR